MKLDSFEFFVVAKDINQYRSVSELLLRKQTQVLRRKKIRKKINFKLFINLE